MAFLYNGFNSVINLDNVTHAELIDDSSGNANFYVVGREEPIVAHIGNSPPAVVVNLRRLTQAIEPTTYN